MLRAALVAVLISSPTLAGDDECLTLQKWGEDAPQGWSNAKTACFDAFVNRVSLEADGMLLSRYAPCASKDNGDLFCQLVAPGGISVIVEGPADAPPSRVDVTGDDNTLVSATARAVVEATGLTETDLEKRPGAIYLSPLQQ